MLTKERLREQLKNLPETFSIDELVERLLLMEKMENGLNQSEQGEILSNTDLDNLAEKWFN